MLTSAIGADPAKPIPPKSNAAKPNAAKPSVLKPSAVMPLAHKALFKTHCLECHDAETREGKVDLENLSFDLGDIKTAEVWQKVLGAINSGDMPPKDSEQIASKAKSQFLEDLSAKIVTARKLLSDSGGVITMRRLNRREYANTMRDLLGVEVDVDDLPEDATSSGFDTNGSSLFFSSDQFEQYLRIARLALDDAILLGPLPKTKTHRVEAEVAANKMTRARLKAFDKKLKKLQAYRDSGKPPTAFGFIDEDRVKFEQGQYDLNHPFVQWYANQPESKTGALMVTSSQGAYLHTTPLPKVPGDYIVRARVGVLPGTEPHRQFLEFGYKTNDNRGGEMNVVGCRAVTGTFSEPCVIEIPVKVTKSSPRSFSLRERQPNNRDAMRRVFRAARAKNKIGPSASIWVDWVEVQGPLVEQWPSESQQQIFFDDKAKKKNDYARQIISRFAARAARIKEPSDSVIDKLMSLYRVERKRGRTFEQAVKEPLAVILASPSFLYLSEPNGKREKREVSDLELAVRLSYFLWSGPPDDELYAVARRGELSDPAILAAQTDRMLDDPRAWEFISGFAHQWLHMERLDFFQFNDRLYPEFDESVKDAARQEIYHTIRMLLTENLSVGKLLKSDFVVINDLLAQYYGIPDVVGAEFRRVDLPVDSPRGGLLGTAAVLAMGSDGERSSPVERGAWIMRKLLHDPPPPAPANVPQLSRLDGKPLSSRKRQNAHMQEPQCAQCHRKIDPLGFGLENFDAAGKWRVEEIVSVLGKKKINKTVNFPINPKGTLPDGAKFEDYFQLRDRIADHENDFARGLTESLIGYGLGRPFGFSDYELAQEILAKTKSQNHRFRSFIHSLVQSKPFRTK